MENQPPVSVIIIQLSYSDALIGFSLQKKRDDSLDRLEKRKAELEAEVKRKKEMIERAKVI